MDLDDVGYVLLAIVLVAIIKWIIDYFLELIKLPAGPWGLPIVGYIPWMDKNTAESFVKISKKYGNIFSITLGSQTVIVLNDWPSVKACLNDQPKNFNGRPPNVTSDTASSRKDIGFSDGPVWEVQKPLVIQCMRNAGLGKSSMEELVTESISHVIQMLHAYDGKSMVPDSFFFKPMIKISWKLIANHHFDSDSDEMVRFDKDIRLLYEEFRPDNLFNKFPWLRFLPPNGFGFKQFVQANDRIMSYLSSVTKSHLNTWTEASKTDFIDHYISKIKSKEAINQADPPYNFDHLLCSVWVLFIAGVDTISAAMEWALLFLAINPDAQKEAQDELDSVIGRNRLPCLTDFPKLPYTEAVVMETLRLANVAPLAAPYRNNYTTKVGNITISKGSTCIPNTYAIHFDPNLWIEPKKFDPRRFINEKNEVKVPPYFLPFSVGSRMCVGKDMAELELKLFVSSLLHQFTFSLPTGQLKSNFDIIPGLVVHPERYSLVVHARNYVM